MTWGCSEILLPVTSTTAHQSQYFEAEFYLPVLLSFFIFIHLQRENTKGSADLRAVTDNYQERTTHWEAN